MSFFQIYWRVLAMLRTETRAVAILVVAAAAMVATQFAEPVLLGRLINTLSQGAKDGHLPSLADLMPTILAWIGFALASIAAAVVVSLLADRLAHRRRLAVMATFFEHALELPLSFHSATHSGRSLKIMLESATGMFVTYLSLFRENLAAFLSLIVILPVSLWFNWRLGLLLVGLMVVVGTLATFVRRRTEVLQHEVEFYNTSLAERASDVLGNVPVIQSFTRVDSELSAMRSLSRTLLAAQMPVLSWWATAVVFGRAASTITLLAIFVLGTVLYLHGVGTIGGIVMFMSFATHDEERIASLLRTVLESKPVGATHWTVRSAAVASGLSKSTVARMLALFNVRPHRSKTFRLSSDPLFVDKVRDIVGLYLNPPDHALVLCVDEKTQVQALERRQPMLPLGLGYIEGVTHDYVRHGTTTLFDALDIANGQVMTQCRARHRHQEFLGFLKHIEANVPSDLDLHLVVDNYAAHEHPKVRAWLAKRPRFTLHFTPTYASWMNQVERWFAFITQRQIRRGSFVSAKDLVAKIEAFVAAAYNVKARPFQWTATSDAIFAKLERLCKAINGTAH